MRALLQLGLNILVGLDMGLNVFPLLGMPGETVSHRVARLRRDGVGWQRDTGCILCWLLTKMFWFMRRDHCQWALRGRPEAFEIWHWSRVVPNRDMFG